MFHLDCEKYLDAVTASNGDGYLAMYNILRYSHPELTESEIETNIPTQLRSDTVGTYFSNVIDCID